MPDRPDVPAPPAAHAPWHRGRPWKQWRWVGAFTDEVLLCAATARIGGLPVSWWAVWDRRTRTLVEHTVRLQRRVVVTAEAVLVADPPHRMELRITDGPAVETVSPHGRAWIWTRKRPATVSGEAVVGERRFALRDAPAFVDESAGYHARETRWRWSAGVGTTAGGASVAWNLVTGVHDAERASERTVWLDGVPHHVPALPFADDLSTVGDLAFTAEATRAHKENRLILATDYVQPFGSFAGTLPVAGAITGLGVMESQSVRW